MSDLPTSKDNVLKALGKVLLFTVCIFIVGTISAPPVNAAAMPQVPKLVAASADQPVPIDQQPLTVAEPLAPNIVLMLDDSGSMAWDVMPDWGNLSSTDDLAVIDSAVNGVYYNPGATYAAPPKANGTSSWPDADFDSAAVNGFYTGNERHEVDLTTYDGDYDSSTSTGFSDGYPNGSSNLGYSIAIAPGLDGTYPASSSCPDGTYASGSQDEYCYYNWDPQPKFYEFYDNVSGGTWYVSKCNQSGYIYDKDTNQCLVESEVDIDWSCSDGEESIGTTTVDYNHNREICVTGPVYHFFTYSTRTGSGNLYTYKRHYVGKYGDCNAAGLQKNVCVDPSQTSPTDPSVQPGMTGAQVLQNVANWFSYYHTRMLMAKSSLMNAFSGLNENYRFGFGSLHNNGGFPDDVTTKEYSDHKIALVQPFGNGSDTSDQKSKFWSWILDKYPHNGTPLRKSLKAIGEYYETAQPWQTSDTDTATLACRQSYAILTTDGFWNGDSPSLGNVDKSDGPDVTVPDSDDTHNTYSPAPPFEDDESNTLADVAMYYWDHDLQPYVSNEVPVSGKADPAFWQHMTTFTIGMGFVPENIEPDGTSAAEIFDWARGGATIENFSWPTPSDDSINNIADLLHTAVNGHGGFYSATSPQAFTEGLQNALKRIASRKGSGASLSASSAKLGTDTYVYQVLYRTGDWSGALYAYKLDANGDPATDPTWSAVTQMPEPDDRNIHTYNPDKSGSDADVAFEFGNLSDTEKAALGDATDAQKDMVQYLRGKLIDKDGWRARLTLGDIVDSQPIYVAAPDSDLYSDSRLDFSGSKDYKAFADAKKDVEPVLYMAANDGMLHGFDADTGKETYAYLPAAVILHGSETGDHHISQIADPDYGYQNGGVPHQYFNDGQLTVADVYMDGSWKVVLVGTTGRGHAKAVYALDVTDPENVSLMWEKSAYSADCDNCAYIGQMTSKPIIAQVADGQWAVLMGNGYNSEKNQAALLQFSLSDGTLHVHTAGTDGDNGLSGPAIWVADQTNNISTVAYAGDLEGHVWSFPLNDGSSTPDSAGTVLFTARDAAGNAQPITAALAIQQDAATGKRWVFFGTGQYLSSADVDNDSSNQTWYGLIVDDEDGKAVAAVTRDNLAQRKIVAEGADSNGDWGRAVSKPSEVDPMGEKDGWYIDLPDTGERMVVANQFNDSLLYGTSIMPSATDLCDPAGSGWVMGIDPFTGTNPTWDVLGSTITTGGGGDDGGDGGDGDPSVTRNTSGTYFSSMPNASIFVGGHMLTSTSSGDVAKHDLKPPADDGERSARISWREVISD